MRSYLIAPLCRPSNADHQAVAVLSGIPLCEAPLLSARATIVTGSIAHIKSFSAKDDERGSDDRLRIISELAHEMLRLTFDAWVDRPER
jgi:hypothetical protein